MKREVSENCVDEAPKKKQRLNLDSKPAPGSQIIALDYLEQKDQSGWKVFTTLPDGVLEHIFRQLDVRSMINCQLVCQLWYYLIKKSANSLPKTHLHEISLDMQYKCSDICLFWQNCRRYRKYSTKGPFRLAWLNKLKKMDVTTYLRHFMADKLQFYECEGKIFVDILKQWSTRWLDLKPNEVVFHCCNFKSITELIFTNFIKAQKQTMKCLKLYRMNSNALTLINDKTLSHVGELETLVIHCCFDVETPFNVTDVTLERLSLQTETCFDRVDLSNCKITAVGVKKLIDAWCNFSPEKRTDSAKIELQRCPVEKRELYSLCRHAPAVVFDPDITGATLVFQIGDKTLTVYFME